jgi:hypothetical protein
VVDGGIELPVELFERFQVPEVSGFGAAFEYPFLAHCQFILEDKFQEVRVAQAVGSLPIPKPPQSHTNATLKPHQSLRAWG